MIAFFVSIVIRLLVPFLYGAAVFFFLDELAIPAFLSLIGAGYLAYLISQQGGRNCTEYLLNRKAGLTQQSSITFILKFSVPFFLSIVAAFAADWLDWKYGFFIPSLSALAAGAAVFWLAYGAVRIVYGPLRIVHIAGRKLLSFREALLKAKELGYEEGLLFGGLRLPFRLATTHFLVIGASGSGKTVTIRLLLEGICSWMKQEPRSHTVIYDPKSNVLPQLNQLTAGELPIIDLHPFRKNAYAWDIASDVRTDRDIEAIVNILIHIDKVGNESRFFAEAPRELMQNVIRGLHKLAKNRWTLRDVYLIMTSIKRMKLVLAQTAEGRDLIPYYFKENGQQHRTLDDIQLSIRTRTLRYRTIAAAHHAAAKAGRLLSLREWSQSQNGFLVLGSEKSEDSGTEALNRVVIDLLTKTWLEGSDSPRRPQHFLVLDEVQSAGKIEALARLLNEGREKGVSAILGFQDISSLQKVYGHGQAEELTAQCAHKALLRLEGDVTSQWASRLVGEADQYDYTYSESTSRGTSDGKSTYSTSKTQNESLSRRAVLKPSDFMTIPPTNTVNGLTGYYGSSEIGFWKQTYNAQELWNSVDSVPPIDPSSSEQLDFELLPFDENDFQRLSIEKYQVEEEDSDESNSDETPELPNVRKIWLEE